MCTRQMATCPLPDTIFLAYQQPQQLVAVAVHHGTGAQEGHYTTYAMRGGAWFHANDTSVKQSTEAAAGNQIASMLWYTRREITHEETEEEAIGTEVADREEQAERSTQAQHNAIKSKIESINQLKGDDWRALICTTGEHGESGWKCDVDVNRRGIVAENRVGAASPCFARGRALCQRITCRELHRAKVVGTETAAEPGTQVLRPVHGTVTISFEFCALSSPFTLVCF
jgi:hypothetical protein